MLSCSGHCRTCPPQRLHRFYMPTSRHLCAQQTCHCTHGAGSRQGSEGSASPLRGGTVGRRACCNDGTGPGKASVWECLGTLGLPRIQGPLQRLKMASGPEAPGGLAARGLGPSPAAAVFLQWQESPGKDKRCKCRTHHEEPGLVEFRHF